MTQLNTIQFGSGQSSLVCEAASQFLNLLFEGSEGEQIMRIYALTDLVMLATADELLALAARYNGAEDTNLNPAKAA